MLSQSASPEHGLTILWGYAQNKAIREGKWQLLTGSWEVIYELGRNYYFVEEDLSFKEGPDDFIHTENYVLIDKSAYPGYSQWLKQSLHPTSHC